MPKAKFSNHKGRNRRFTNPEELEQERIREEKQKTWRVQNRELPPSESEDSEDELSDDASDDSSHSDEASGKTKGVEGLISIENPNRIQKKTKKLSTLTENDNVQLSRREREELEKQKAALHYQKLHAEGKTEEARSDLARLAIIKQQREEAAKKREQEKKEKELAKQSKSTKVTGKQ